VGWFKVKALSSNPSITEIKKKAKTKKQNEKGQARGEVGQGCGVGEPGMTVS
jgi:hypothetical protein